MPGFNTPVYILCHSYRHRLADTDGISVKAVIDALVKSGILGNDTTKQIKQISFKQTKISKQEEEKTEITIE